MGEDETGRGADRDILLTFPSEDALFELTVADAVAEARSGSLTLEAARRRIRETYPLAVVYRRHGASAHGESGGVTAAFRDGGTRPVYQPEAWWLYPGTARAVVDWRGRVTALNQRARAILTPDGGPTFAVAIPEAIARLVADGSLLNRLGEVTSTAIWPGAPSDLLDYHLAPSAAGNGRHVVWLRTAPERDAAAIATAAEASSLGALGARTRSTLVAGAERHDLLPGERLSDAMPGTGWAVLVVAGLVRVYAGGAIESTVTYGRRACLLGSHLAFEEDCAVGLQAITPSVVLHLAPERIAELTVTSPAFARALLGEERKHVKEIVRSQVMHATARQVQQLATELLIMDGLQATQGFLLVTEQQLADAVGTIRESVGRSIAKLRRTGAIATTRHGVLILDTALLLRIASGAA